MTRALITSGLIAVLGLTLPGCGGDDGGVAGPGGLGGSSGSSGGSAGGGSGGSAGSGGAAAGGTGGNIASGGSSGAAGSGGAAGSAGSAGSGGGSAGAPPKDELCVVEAENYTSQNGYTKVNQSGASGGAAMQVGGSGSLNFDFDFKTGGRYYIWLRTLAADSENNGLFISLDGKRIEAPSGHPQAGVSDIYLKKSGNWQWEPEWQGSSGHSGPITFDATPGKHSLSIEKRKIERPLIDKLVINKSSSPPSGTGPAEQACK